MLQEMLEERKQLKSEGKKEELKLLQFYCNTFWELYDFFIARPNSEEHSSTSRPYSEEYILIARPYSEEHN